MRAPFFAADDLNMRIEIDQPLSEKPVNRLTGLFGFNRKSIFSVPFHRVDICYIYQEKINKSYNSLEYVIQLLFICIVCSKIRKPNNRLTACELGLSKTIRSSQTSLAPKRVHTVVCFCVNNFCLNACICNMNVRKCAYDLLSFLQPGVSFCDLTYRWACGCGCVCAGAVYVMLSRVCLSIPLALSAR